MRAARFLGPPPVRIRLRWMVHDDCPDVLATEASSSLHPLDGDTLATLLRRKNVIGMVADDGAGIVGHMLYELHPGRIEVLAFGVHPEYRRRGIGRRMADELHAKLRPSGRTRLVYRVRETDLPLQLFLRAVGFEAIAVNRQHYADTGEDAYAMERWFDHGARMTQG